MHGLSISFALGLASLSRIHFSKFNSLNRLLYTVLLRYFAELISWLSILLVLAGIIALGYFVFNYANTKYP